MKKRPTPATAASTPPANEAAATTPMSKTELLTAALAKTDGEIASKKAAFAGKFNDAKVAQYLQPLLEKKERQQAALLAEKYGHYGDGSDSGSSSDSD